MRKITDIIIHCSATRVNRNYTFTQCRQDHIKYNHWPDIGYHYYIEKNGSIYSGRAEHTVGAHCLNHDSSSLGICYEGGLDEQGKPSDTRTKAQRKSFLKLLKILKLKYPDAIICGHRDMSPDMNHDDKISPWEYIRLCPCFDAKTEYELM